MQKTSIKLISLFGSANEYANQFDKKTELPLSETACNEHFHLV